MVDYNFSVVNFKNRSFNLTICFRQLSLFYDLFFRKIDRYKNLLI